MENIERGGYIRMTRVFVMRYNKGKLPPSTITEEMKKEITEKMSEFLKDNPDVKFNGLWVNKEGIGICDWEAPDAETVRKAVEAVGSPYDEVIEVEKIL